MKYSVQIPLQVQALSKIKVNPCTYGTVMFIFYHFSPLQTNYRSVHTDPPKNYNAENEGFLKLSTIHEKP